MRTMKITKLNNPLKVGHSKLCPMYYTGQHPMFCYGCGRYMNRSDVYYLFTGKVFCCMNCVEDHIKHFDGGALFSPWVMDEDVYNTWQAERKQYEHIIPRR